MAKIGINIATGSLQKQEIIVGIDLGTTNSLIAIIHPETKKAIALKEHNSSSIVPSIVYFDDANNILVGDVAKQHLIHNPSRTIYSAKRLMGKSYKDVKEQSAGSYKIIDDGTETLVKVQVENTFYSPVDLSSFILKELKQRAEHILKTPVNKAVISVPAYFNDTQRQATRDAGKLAGLDVLRIINEPTAASLAYGIGLHKEDHKTLAVYDLGGGTFDISILKIANGIFEVLATNGDTYLGGDDLDEAIKKYWINLLELHESQIEIPNELRLKAEEAKRHLSFEDTYTGDYHGKTIAITREIFEELASPLIQKTITCCINALKDAKLEIRNIDEVIMVGGSTRVPAVRHAVAKLFGRPVNDSMDPDEVVALGAALQADILAGNNKEFLLLDITPLSLGIETIGGLMDVLIPRNSKIPNKISRQYTTQKDGQGGMRISVFQGERDLVKDNRKLAEFSLSGIPGMPAGFPKVEVSFLINADGILIVTAKELRSGVEQSIEVKPQYGLSDDEVERMLLSSLTHAKDDMAARALLEVKTVGEQLLATTEKFIQKNASLIEQKEMLDTADAMQALQLALTMNEKDLIHRKVEELNNISRPYAERIMDITVSNAMEGRMI